MQKNMAGSRKGQSSLEFLMTYGWAIIVVAVAVLVLGQWGVFNPAMNVRSTYLGFWGVVPLDFSYNSHGDLKVSFQNNIMEGDINITRINVSSGGKSYSTDVNLFIASGTLYAWPSSTTSLSGTTSGLPGGQTGGSYNMLMSIEYKDSRVGNETVFRSSGTIQGNIEAV